MITFNDIHKSFGKNQVLKGVDLEIKPGHISAILGPNGSGKTTLIKTMLGLVIPDKGNIILDGQSIRKQWNYRKKIGYLPQIARFPENLRVKELFHMIGDIRQEPTKTSDLIDFFEVEGFLDERLRNLSGGTRQKINAILAFMFPTDILVLDEPTVGLDPIALIKLKDLVIKEKEVGRTILLSSHIMSVVEELADEIIFLLEGHIHFQGSLNELLETYKESRLEHAIAAMLKAAKPPKTPEILPKQLTEMNGKSLPLNQIVDY